MSELTTTKKRERGLCDKRLDLVTGRRKGRTAAGFVLHSVRKRAEQGKEILYSLTLSE